jgi:feruloyl esterase
MTLKTRLAASVAATSLAVGLASLAGGAAAAQTACADLKSLSLDGARIDVAEAIAPDPVWPFPASAFNVMAGPNAGVRTPFCRVAGVAEPEIGFEVWLPEDWNGKIQNVGNGGYSGAFNYPAASQALALGYAAGTTDVGHKDNGMFDAAWAVGHPERVESFTHRAHHMLAVVSKAIVAARYGRPQDYAYFTGCSSGGRQGLTEAQLYPEDYDGIVAGAPASNWVRLETSMLWFAENSPTGAPLDPPLLALVANAAVAHCDPQDGVTDGIISRPEACDFDPAQLACEDEAAAQCLTPEQVETARLMHGRRKTAGGLSVYPGRSYGTTFRGEVGPPAPFPQTLIAVMESEHEWSAETFDFDRDVPALEAEFGRELNAYDPNMKAFAERGGKLILWHGWTDPLLTPYNTIDYFEAVKAEMGEAAVQDFARLYLAPGVNHCAGGAGPDRYDALTLVEAWVERGEAPDRLIASKLGPDGQPTMTRPLCPYPQSAVYDGQGDPNDAASFTCAEP